MVRKETAVERAGMTYREVLELEQLELELPETTRIERFGDCKYARALTAAGEVVDTATGEILERTEEGDQDG